MRAALTAPVVLLALVAPIFPGAAGTTPGRLRVIVTPQSLRLADGGRAVVRIAGDVESPVVAASAGRIEGLREVASGVFEAEYVPPDGVDPQIAVITAASPSSFGWAALPLAGVREVVVRAPHRTLVSVTVAGETFGPVPATVAGKAVVRVAVPPGVRFATYGRTRISLDVPRTAPSHVAVAPASVDANRGGTVTVRALALDERGEPLPQARVRLSASEGRISAPLEVAPGVVEARWDLPAGKVGDAVVTAELPGRPAARAAVRRVAGPPARVQLAGDRPAVVAGDDVLGVTGRVLDAAGNPTDAPARLVVSLGVGDAASVLPDAVVEWSGSGGMYSGRVLVPRGRSGRQQLELRMIVGGARTLVGTATIALLPGAPDQLRIEPQSELVADGHEKVLRVSVFDQQGNRVDPPASPVVTALRGKVGPASRERAGVYRAGYRPPLAADDFSDVISTRVGAVEGRAEVRVRARGGAIVVAPKAGFTASTGDVRSPDVGAEVGFWTRSLGMSVGLVLEGRYFTFARTERVAGLDVKTRGTFTALEASGAWRRPLVHGMVWLGAGGGLVSASSTAEVTGQAKVGARSWIPSAHASVGWGLPIGPGIPFAEAKVTAQAAPGSGPLRGSLTALTFSLGYRFDVL